MTILHKIGAVIGTLFLTVGGWLNPVPASAPIAPPAVIQELPQVSLGTAIPKVIAVFTTSLQSAISTSDTSMTLVSGTDKAGNAISGYTCFNIDEGSVSEEFVCGTASSTSVTGMIRGVDPVNGSLEVSTLKKAHRRGAIVKITNYPVEGIIARILNGTDTVPNKLTYDPSVSTSSFSNNQELVSKGYADSLTFSGAPNGSFTQKGIYEEATQAELFAGTATGTTLADLAAPARYFNGTSTATTTVPVTGSNGKLSQGFLDLTQAFSFTGGVTANQLTVSGTSTLATTTVSGKDVASRLSKFGGTGADGALSLSGGSTSTIALGSAQVVVKNYTSISLTGTSSLAFSGPATNGTIVILKSQGACTLTSATTTMIDTRGMGAAASTNGIGMAGGPTTQHTTQVEIAGPSAQTSGVAGVGVHIANLLTRNFNVFAGAGGGTAPVGGNAVNATAGRGAGGLYIECAGALNFTGTINASGGAASTPGSGLNWSGFWQDGSGGGGNDDGGLGGIGSSGVTGTGLNAGGGGGGAVILVANSVTASSGTITVNGGSSGGSGSGGAGVGFVATNTEL